MSQEVPPTSFLPAKCNNKSAQQKRWGLLRISWVGLCFHACSDFGEQEEESAIIISGERKKICAHFFQFLSPLSSTCITPRKHENCMNYMHCDTPMPLFMCAHIYIYIYKSYVYWQYFPLNYSPFPRQNIMSASASRLAQVGLKLHSWPPQNYFSTARDISENRRIE